MKPVSADVNPEQPSSLGRSKIVPYRHNEAPAARHARRKFTNVKWSDVMRQWAKTQHIRVKITNDGDHWTLTNIPHVAEWWPSSAKLVMNRDYQNEIHAHDYKQVMQFLERKWALKHA